MTSLISWIPSATITALGWALIHFLWQGAAIAALAAGLMQACRRPATRYLIGVASLVLMLAAPFTTFFLLGAAAPAAIDFAQMNAAAGIAPDVSGLASSALRLGDAVIAPPLLHAAPPDLLPWLVEAWACGVALLSLRFAGSFLLLGQARRGQSGNLNPGLLALCHEVQQRLGIHRTIRYLESRWLQAPAGFGCFRPVILLPIAALTGLSEAQLRAVIAHELAHIRRWDFAVNLFQVVVGTLLFYHPAIWWLNKRIRAEREICCDEIAVSAYGNPLEYARALAFLAEWRNAPALAMAVNRGMLTDRIRRLVRGESFHARPVVAAMAGSLFLLIASLAGGNALLALGFPQLHAGTQHIAVRSDASGGPRLESTAMGDAHPATTARLDDKRYVIPRRKWLTAIRTVRPSQLSSISFPPVIAPADWDSQPSPDNQPVIAASQMDGPSAPVHVISVAAEELAALAVSDDQYPAPVLNLSASRGLGEWTEAETIDYCRNYATQTVTQGANRPISVDEDVKQRLLFFDWHCMRSNAQMPATEYVSPHGPTYSPVGTASPDHPVNVSGSWAIAFPPFAASRSCTFTQTGNSLSGTCARSEGGGVARGVVDGRQVRWSWIYLDDEKRQAELDFIGMMGAGGAITGQSIAPRNPGIRGMIQPFTAVPGAPVTQVASQ